MTEWARWLADAAGPSQKSLGALVRQLRLSTSSRGSWIDHLQFIARDHKWPRLLDARIVRVRAAFKAHGERLTSLVPKVAMLPCTTALFSSGVPCTRLFAANFGMSERIMIEE